MKSTKSYTWHGHGHEISSCVLTAIKVQRSSVYMLILIFNEI